MRNVGGILLLLGILGFFYASMRRSDLAPAPEGLSATQALENPAGRWDVVRYGCAAAGALGFLMLLLPKAR